MGAGTSDGGYMPDWIPQAVQDYLHHTLGGRSIRAVARDAGCDPSTVSRRVRRVELWRDDPLIDSALHRLGRSTDKPDRSSGPATERDAMIEQTELTIPTDHKFEREARRVLRRLAEQGACLALAPGMDTAVVVRETCEGGPTLRTAVVERGVAEAMALHEWIHGSAKGRILRYRITAAGRSALKRLVAQEESQKASARAQGHDLEQDGYEVEADHGERRGSVRYSLAESPLAALARRRDKAGTPFLGEDLVAAGERLREDFELAQIGRRSRDDWDRFVTGAERPDATAAPGSGADAARSRVQMALAALGPGLGDVALRCCCYLEGLESAEQRMGWSARSGKIVLRIALQRLKGHYDANADHWSPLIG